MTRKECLDAAAGCVLKDRQNQYGGPENNFERIAQMWNGYLGTNSIKPWDVAAMMGMLKMARARYNPKYADNWVDLAGYAACGIECATAQEEFDKALDKHQQEIFDRMFNKAGGNHPENPDSSIEAKPKFKRGDKVQYRVVLPSVSDSLWLDGVYVRYDKNTFRPHVVYAEDTLLALNDEDIRPAPKAEGCEDLVCDEARMRESMPGIVPQDGPSDFDAPQTREALCQHIVDCNPSVYPRTPTGEELAEMAEEDGNA